MSANKKIDHLTLRKRLVDGVARSEIEKMRNIDIAPNCTVGEYIHLMKYDGGIVEENGKYILFSSKRHRSQGDSINSKFRCSQAQT